MPLLLLLLATLPAEPPELKPAVAEKELLALAGAELVMSDLAVQCRLQGKPAGSLDQVEARGRRWAVKGNKLRVACPAQGMYAEAGLDLTVVALSPTTLVVDSNATPAERKVLTSSGDKVFTEKARVWLRVLDPGADAAVAQAIDETRFSAAIAFDGGPVKQPRETSEVWFTEGKEKEAWIIAKPPASPPLGRYVCQKKTSALLAESERWGPSSLGVIALKTDGTYFSEKRGAGGTTRFEGNQLEFKAGPLEGWVATPHLDRSTRYLLRFRESARGAPTQYAERNDDYCFIQEP